MPTSTRTVPCPRCGKQAAFAKEQNPWRPFCSQRCKTNDLGAWASEKYRVATDQGPEPEDPSNPEEKR